MKTLKHLSTILILLCFVACSNKFSLQKRKYRKGFFFDLANSKSSSKSKKACLFECEVNERVKNTILVEPFSNIVVLNENKTEGFQQGNSNNVTSFIDDSHVKSKKFKENQLKTKLNFASKKTNLNVRKPLFSRILNAIWQILIRLMISGFLTLVLLIIAVIIAPHIWLLALSLAIPTFLIIFISSLFTLTPL